MGQIHCNQESNRICTGTGNENLQCLQKERNQKNSEIKSCIESFSICIPASERKNSNHKIIRSQKRRLRETGKFSKKFCFKNGNIRLTAQRSTSKKAVAVKVLVKTAGGASRTITVTVQSNQVTTKKITGIARSLSVKRGKTITLKPARYPFTSQEKITYTSSNKKIATVDANGRVKGIKTGSAVITVKSGKAVYKTTVKVTK